MFLRTPVALANAVISSGLFMKFPEKAVAAVIVIQNDTISRCISVLRKIQVEVTIVVQKHES